MEKRTKEQRMNHAEKVKDLAQGLAEAHSHYCLADDGEPADYALEWRREAVNNLHAAIDEMQAEIDRLNQDGEEMALRFARCAHDLFVEKRYTIPEMQAEIDRLTSHYEQSHKYERLLIGCRSAMRAAGQKANYKTDWQHMIAAIDAAMKAQPTEAMAELQKEAQERGDYGRGDKT